MAKRSNLSNTPPPNAFAEGAARFAEIARQVKAQQAIEQQSEPAGPLSVREDAPDEIWARKFMNQAIGPTGSDLVMAAAPVWHAPAATSEFASLRAAMRRSEEFSSRGALGLPPRPVTGTPMRTRLGKNEKPRRSWLGRLFRGA